ncbi:DUF2079 domain-containing protein [Kribbia dieselivorans]|uniref:DUF2079 domain-containing protein n=1 Tax=Kribbia dieselivorans TaxID=331526 RepID=UPI0008388EAC|nr:DUF2079 domain-containing protein [Kribbia dieselivorans]
MSAPATRRPTLRRPDLKRHPRAVIGLTFFALYALYAVSRYRQFLTSGYDLGIFDQAVMHYAHFRPPYVALKGPDYNLLGDHFHPILVTLAPLYWIWNDPRTLLIAQAGLVAISVVLVHGFVERHMGRLAASLAAIGYGVSWPIQGLIDFDFHEVAFAVPLLVVIIDALDRRRDIQLLAASAALLLVREDMGLLVVMIAIVRAFRAPRWPAIVLAIAGPAMYVFATYVVLPHFNPSGEFAYWTYDALGPDLISALTAILTRPWDAIALFVTPSVKAVTLAWLFVPLLLLPLRSPYVLLAAPLLAQRFWSSRYMIWTTELHYSAVVYPILFLAAIDGARRLGLHRNRRFISLWLAGLIALPAVGIVVDRYMWPFYRIIRPEVVTLTPHMRDQAAIVAAIPPNTCIEVDDRLVPQLNRTNRTSVPTHLGHDADFIALDRSQIEPSFEVGPVADVERDVIARGYVKVMERGDLVLYRSPHFRGPDARKCGPIQ